MTDVTVAAVGWHLLPVLGLKIRFVCTLDKQPRTMLRPRFRLDISAQGPAAFHLREGHAITVSALILSLLRGLAPLLNMLDSNAKWPMCGDGIAGWINVTEATGGGAAAAAARAAGVGLCALDSLGVVSYPSTPMTSAAARTPGRVGGGRRMSFESGAQLRVWGGCWVTTGSGMLQFAAVDGERRSIFFDTWDIIEESPTAVTLFTKSCTTVSGKPRAVTLHAESRAIAAGWLANLRSMQRSHRMGGTLHRDIASGRAKPRYRRDDGKKRGVRRPPRLSIEESSFICLGITVRLSELTAAIYPPDGRTGDTYSHLDALPPLGIDGDATASTRPAALPSTAREPPRVGDMGNPLLIITMRRVGYDYFMRLHDMSMLLTVGDLTGYCDGLGITAPASGGVTGSPMLLGTPLSSGVRGGLRPRLSERECREIFNQLDCDGDGHVSLAELRKQCKTDTKIRMALGLRPKLRGRVDSSPHALRPGTRAGSVSGASVSGASVSGASAHEGGTASAARSGRDSVGSAASSFYDVDPIDALFAELDADGSNEIEFEEFEALFGGGVELLGSSGSIFSPLPALPRLTKAERRWPMGGDAAEQAWKEDFLQVRLSNSHPHPHPSSLIPNP